MAYDFPNSPSSGQIFVPAAGGPQWTWNGTAWTSSGGSSLGMQIIDYAFTTSGTYTPGSGLLYAEATVQAPGGGGGGCAATAASQVGAGAGGGGGSWATALFSATQISPNVVLTIGAGGTSGSGVANGGTGGNTSFGSLIVCGGGLGGGSMTSINYGMACLGGGTVSTAPANARTRDGDPGGTSWAVNQNTATCQGMSGRGGSSVLAKAVGEQGVILAATGGIAGLAGSNYGGGGSGAYRGASNSATAVGGIGGNAIIFVREYYSFAGQAPAPGTIIERVYTGASTWTKPAGLIALEVEIQSPGGGGGGAPATGASQYSVGGGGGSGALGRQLYQANDPVLTATVAVTIGSVGTGSVGLSGGTGGTSSFGTGISVSGGVGGLNGAAGATSTGSPGAGGIVSNGAVAVKGGRGLWGYAVFAATYLNFGQGADGPSGSGGQNTVAPGGTGGGTAGTGYGAGGGGGTALASAGAQTGGQGAPSYVKVREFY